MSRTIRIASVLLAVGLPTTWVLNTQPGHGPEAGSVPSVPSPLPKQSKGLPPPVLPRSLPIGRWKMHGPRKTRGRGIEIEFLANGRLTGRTGGTAFVGTWGGETGKLIAKGESSTQPEFRFECDLVYVEYERSPRSSYVIADCANAQDRWRWELTTAGP